MPIETLERVAETGKEAQSSPRHRARTLKLTRREYEVIVLISEGFSSKEAAEKLFLSKRTIDFHLANIYDKVEAVVGSAGGNRNRLWAIRWLRRYGIIPFDPLASAQSLN